MTEADRAGGAVLQRLQQEPCDVCGAPTFELHCKVICRTCGYTRDCGDP